MEVLSFIEHEFYKSDVCKTLFNLEFVIYGKFIRQSMNNEFTKDTPIGINIYGKLTYRVLLEKMLVDYINNIVIITPMSSLYNKNVIANYYIKVNDICYVLDVVYINDLHIDNIDYFKKELYTPINIDSLFIKDNTLGVLEHIDNKYTLFSILEDIKYKRFHISDKKNLLARKEIDYVKKLIELGYRNKDRVFKSFYRKAECKICYDDEEVEYSRFKCGHIFHTRCIKESVNETMIKNSDGFFKCPYCQTKYLNFEVL
tara:strand:+ start:123 stop:896 length:774 start_codon:yes stop_codon:yes gene_type:complete